MTFRRNESNDISPRPWRQEGYTSTVAEVFEAEPVIRDVDGHVHYLGYVERLNEGEK